MRVQDGEKVISGCDFPFVLSVVIFQECIKGFIADAGTHVTQEVCAVEVNDQFIVLIILTLIDRDVDIAEVIADQQERGLRRRAVHTNRNTQ